MLQNVRGFSSEKLKEYVKSNGPSAYDLIINNFEAIGSLRFTPYFKAKAGDDREVVLGAPEEGDDSDDGDLFNIAVYNDDGLPLIEKSLNESELVALFRDSLI